MTLSELAEEAYVACIDAEAEAIFGDAPYTMLVFRRDRVTRRLRLFREPEVLVGNVTEWPEGHWEEIAVSQRA